MDDAPSSKHVASGEAANADVNAGTHQNDSSTERPTTESPHPGIAQTRPPTTPATPSNAGRRPDRQRTHSREVEMMGPILRRKKVVSMPLCGVGAAESARAHDQFFYDDRHGPRASVVPAAMLQNESPAVRQELDDQGRRLKQVSDGYRFKTHDIANERQITPPAPLSAQPAPGAPRRRGQRTRQRSTPSAIMTGIMRRKQVSLDLLAPEAAEFFAGETSEELEEPLVVLEPAPEVPEEEEIEKISEEEGAEQIDIEAGKAKPTEGKGGAKKEHKEKNLFRPLVFAPPRRPDVASGGHHGTAEPATVLCGGVPPQYQDEVEETIRLQEAANMALRESLTKFKSSRVLDVQDLEAINELDAIVDSFDENVTTMRSHLLPTIDESKSLLIEGKSASGTVTAADGALVDTDLEDVESDQFKDEDDGAVSVFIPAAGGIAVKKATRKDYYITAFLFVLMCALTSIIAGWQTHLDESHSIFGVVGLACVTYCPGNTETKDYFHGNYNFGSGEVVELVIGLDPIHNDNYSGGEHEPQDNGSGHRWLAEEDEELDAYLRVDIVGVESGLVKWTGKFGPASQVRETFVERVDTDGWEDAEEDHVINSYSTQSPDTELAFTMNASTLTPLADHSEIVAAVIMVVVYVFILLEIIHRTLVAIFGSLVALFFFFLMHNGHTESVATIMLHLEWSTLGLLFGMMLIVGELSHTGIFEWCSVRLLGTASGSYNRLVLLLCTLTAASSAFLDNVTTMLLVAPVTIDLCNILQVDPRPYLIGEVLLSNVGGTATLIGDPPNIIIGSAYEEIGFVDFIINIAPVIVIFCIPATLALVVLIYKPYFSSSKMRKLDMKALKATYPIYDEPRLLIAGTVTFFVIIMFFLHPVHHKDTAWIALLGAFITIAFTNPHDVQDALRNHVEWDTLLFFAGLFVLVEVCAAMGLLRAIGNALASYIASQPEESQLAIAITLILWVSAITSAFLDNIPYTATMIPVVQILSDNLDTLPLETLAWALSLGACLGGNGTLLGASANIVTAGVSTNKGYSISFLNFLYPGMITMIVTVLISNIYLLVVFVWV